MTDLTSNQDYFYNVVEIDNSAAYTGREDYVINMPQAVGLNFKYSEMCFDVKTTPDFSGNVAFTFNQSFTDTANNEYDIPALISQPHDIINTTGQLTEANLNQTWKLNETSIRKLKITFEQVTGGAGKIFLVIRATI